MPTIRITDVRVEPWYTVTKGKSPANPNDNVTPSDLSAAFKTALAKEVDVDYLRYRALANPYVSSDISFKNAGDAAMAELVKGLDSLRAITVRGGPEEGSTITPSVGRYIEHTGGGHTKASFLTRAARGASDLWRLRGVQVKDARGGVETEFDGAVALAIDYVVVVKDPPPKAGTGGAPGGG